MTGTAKASRAVGYSLVDASTSSLASFAVGLYAARYLSAMELGVYGLYFSAFVLAGMLHAEGVFASSEVALLRFDPRAQLRAIPRSLCAGTVAGVVASVTVIGATTLLAPRGNGAVTTSIAAGAAVVSVISPSQDHLRRMFHQTMRSQWATVVAVVQLVSVLAALGAGAALGVARYALPFLALGVANVISLSVGLTLAAREWAPVTPPGVNEVLRPSALARVGGWLLVGSGVERLALLVAMAGVTHAAGTAAAGYIEGSRVMAQPVFVLGVGTITALRPRIVAASQQRDLAQAQRWRRASTALVGGGMVVYATVAGVRWWGNPLPRLSPIAFEKPGLVVAMVVSSALSVMLSPLAIELVGAGRARVFGQASVIYALVVSAAGVGLASAGLSSYALPVAWMGAIPLRFWLYRRGLRGHYEGPETYTGRRDSTSDSAGANLSAAARLVSGPSRVGSWWARANPWRHLPVGAAVGALVVAAAGVSLGGVVASGSGWRYHTIAELMTTTAPPAPSAPAGSGQPALPTPLEALADRDPTATRAAAGLAAGLAASATRRERGAPLELGSLGEVTAAVDGTLTVGLAAPTVLQPSGAVATARGSVQVDAGGAARRRDGSALLGPGGVALRAGPGDTLIVRNDGLIAVVDRRGLRWVVAPDGSLLAVARNSALAASPQATPLREGGAPVREGGAPASPGAANEDARLRQLAVTVDAEEARIAAAGRTLVAGAGGIAVQDTAGRRLVLGTTAVTSRVILIGANGELAMVDRAPSPASFGTDRLVLTADGALYLLTADSALVAATPGFTVAPTSPAPGSDDLTAPLAGDGLAPGLDGEEQTGSTPGRSKRRQEHVFDTLSAISGQLGQRLDDTTPGSRGAGQGQTLTVEVEADDRVVTGAVTEALIRLSSLGEQPGSGPSVAQGWAQTPLPPVARSLRWAPLLVGLADAAAGILAGAAVAVAGTARRAWGATRPLPRSARPLLGRLSPPVEVAGAPSELSAPVVNRGIAAALADRCETNAWRTLAVVEIGVLPTSPSPPLTSRLADALVSVGSTVVVIDLAPASAPLAPGPGGEVHPPVASYPPTFEAGFAEWATGRARLVDAVHTSSRPGQGRTASKPAALMAAGDTRLLQGELSPAALATLFEPLTAHYDFVLVRTDGRPTPAIVAGTPWLVAVTRATDAVVFVGPEPLSHRRADAAADAVARLDIPVVGTLLCPGGTDSPTPTTRSTSAPGTSEATERAPNASGARLKS